MTSVWVKHQPSELCCEGLLLWLALNRAGTVPLSIRGGYDKRGGMGVGPGCESPHKPCGHRAAVALRGMPWPSCHTALCSLKDSLPLGILLGCRSRGPSTGPCCLGSGSSSAHEPGLLPGPHTAFMLPHPCPGPYRICPFQLRWASSAPPIASPFRCSCHPSAGHGGVAGTASPRVTMRLRLDQPQPPLGCGRWGYERRASLSLVVGWRRVYESGLRSPVWGSTAAAEGAERRVDRELSACPCHTLSRG